MTQHVNIRWHTVADFEATRGFLKRKVPELYHMTESEAFHMLLAQPLPAQLLEAIQQDPDVQVWGLKGKVGESPSLWVGLPQVQMGTI